MGRARSETTFEDDRLAAPSGHFATKLTDGARTVVAHGATPEESRRRAAQLWEIRDEQIAEASAGEVDERLKVAFEELALSWSAETAHLSSPLKLIQHPAYRQIIGLGPAALPLLFRDLAETGRFWFPALHAITGENPVRTDDEGDVRKMAGAWIEWGRQHGLIQ